ncbi:MAG: FecR domain-containing protein [Spirochaetales bacterium]|nr:FecR domain-containing protein [Spirochaetales bacterium]
MKTSEKIILLLGIFTLLGAAILLTVLFVFAPGSEREVVALAALKAPSSDQALVTFLSGEVFIYRNNEWKAVEIGDYLEADDFVRVFADSYCEVQFGDNSIISIQENTLLHLNEVYHSDSERDIEIDIKLGTLLCRVEKITGNTKFRVKSSLIAFGVRGTEFLLRKAEGRTLLAVREGKVALITLDSGEERILVGEKQEIEIDDESGRLGELSALSELNKSQLELIEKLKLLPLKEKYIIELVKIAVVVDPLDAEIYLAGERVGYGVYAGLFTVGEELSFIIRRNGYQEKRLIIPVEKGGDSEYRIKLELAEPLTGLSDVKITIDMKAMADELEDNIELLEQKLKVTELEKDRFKSKIDTLNDRIEQIAHNETELKVQITKLKDEKTKLEAELNKMKDDMLVIKKELDEKTELLRSIHEDTGDQ